MMINSGEPKPKHTSVELEKGHIKDAVTSLLRRTRDEAVKKCLFSFRENANKLESFEELLKLKPRLGAAALLPKLGRRFAIPLIDGNYIKLAEEVSKGVRFEEMNKMPGHKVVLRKKAKKVEPVIAVAKQEDEAKPAPGCVHFVKVTLGGEYNTGERGSIVHAKKADYYLNDIIKGVRECLRVNNGLSVTSQVTIKRLGGGIADVIVSPGTYAVSGTRKKEHGCFVYGGPLMVKIFMPSNGVNSGF